MSSLEEGLDRQRSAPHPALVAVWNDGVRGAVAIATIVRQGVRPVPLKHPQAHSGTPQQDLTPAPVFTLEGMHIPRHTMPEGPMAPDAAYQVIHDELMLDGNARLNLATFVTTWMEPQARLLMAECLDKNMIDKDEYPQTAELEMRCVNILGGLWRAPDTAAATGCSTTGSSEAAMLGGLALKRLWQQRRKAAASGPTSPTS